MSARLSIYPTRSNAAMPNEGVKTRVNRLRLLRDSLLDCHELGMASFFDEQLVVINGNKKNSPFKKRSTHMVFFIRFGGRYLQSCFILSWTTTI